MSILYKYTPFKEMWGAYARCVAKGSVKIRLFYRIGKNTQRDAMVNISTKDWCEWYQNICRFHEEDR